MATSHRIEARPKTATEAVRRSYDRADAFFRELADEGANLGIEVRCRPGCAACCAYLVHVTTAEARTIAAAIQALPHATRTAIVDRLVAWERAWALHAARHNGDRLGAKAATVAAWQVRQVACPLLDPDSRRCLAYADRPIACRVHHAASINAEAEPMCDRCPNVEAPEACITTPEHVRHGHAPWVWQLRNDLIPMFGAVQVDLVLASGADPSLVVPDVLPIAVAKLGRARYGWRSNRVVELPVVAS